MAKALTDRKLKSLRNKPPKAGTTLDVDDGVVRSLKARVMPSGEISFVLVARYPGSKNPTRRSLGCMASSRLKRLARKRASGASCCARGSTRMQRNIGIGNWNCGGRRTRLTPSQKNSSSGTFLKPGRPRSSNVSSGGESIERWTGRPITDITQHDVVAVIDAAVDRDAPYQAHNLLGHVRTLFNWAIARGVYGLDRSPCDRMRPAAVIGKKLARQRILNDDGIRACGPRVMRLAIPTPHFFGSC